MSENDKLIAKALKIRESENFDESLQILEELYIKNPTKDIERHLIDTLFLAGGYYNDIYVLEFEKAVSMFKRIIKIDITNYRAHYNLGIAYSNLENFDLALASYNKAIELKPDYKYCFYNIGLIHEEREDFKKALEYYEKALDIDPKFTYALQAQYHVRKIIDSQRRIKNF